MRKVIHTSGHFSPSGSSEGLRWTVPPPLLEPRPASLVVTREWPFLVSKRPKGCFRRYAIIRLVGGAGAIAVSVVWVMYMLVRRCEERTL